MGAPRNRRTWIETATGMELMVDSGGYGADKRGLDHDEHALVYTSWVKDNIGRISLVTEYDPAGASLQWVEQWRNDFWDEVPPDKFLPIWHEGHGLEELERLCAKYPRVGMTKPESGAAEAKMRSLAATTEVRFHGIGITGPDDLRRLPISTANSTSWVSPTRHGDTQVWAGGRFHWYPAKSKRSARARHRSDVAKAGFDSTKYEAGDRDTVAAYTVWAWKQYESDLASRRAHRGALHYLPGAKNPEVVDLIGVVDLTETRNQEGGVVDLTTQQPRKAELVRRDDKMLFPGLARSMEKSMSERSDGPESVPVLGLSESGLRVCSSCYLSIRCPAYRPEAECAYHMPVEIRTKEQLMRSLTSVLEMQMARVAFARAGEEADVGLINQDVSSEIERFMKMVKDLKEIQSDTTFLRIEAKGKESSGVLTQLLTQAFGHQQGTTLGAQARALNDLDPSRAEEVVRDFIDLDEED